MEKLKLEISVLLKNIKDQVMVNPFWIPLLGHRSTCQKKFFSMFVYSIEMICWKMILFSKLLLKEMLLMCLSCIFVEVY